MSKDINTNRPFNTYFDHTLLKPDATQSDIERLCEEAKKYSFYSVCVNSGYVALAADILRGSGVRITSVVGFPLGSMESSAKAYEADKACDDGAEEIDMVMNIGAMKSGNTSAVKDDIDTVATICYDHDVILKVIIETCLLTDNEIVTAAKIAESACAEFVKTSTGFADPMPGKKTNGATVNDVRLIRSVLAPETRIKASGGIKTLADAMAMIESGACRLGCSNSVSIMEEYLRS